MEPQAIAEALAGITQSPDVPEQAKAAFQASLEAFQAGLEILQGGGAAEPHQPSGPVSMEQGASGAQPISQRGGR